jgi:hypothetical protein
MNFYKIFLILSILHPLQEIESNCKTSAIGDSGEAYGILQIHEICVKDVNRIYGTEYKHEEMLKEILANQVFILYLSAGFDRYLYKYGRNPSIEDLVRMWNGGIYKGYKKESTKKYYLKFKEVYKNN